MSASHLNSEAYPLIKDVVCSLVKGCFSLPHKEGVPNIYVVPLSSGLDSFATAYSLLAYYPEVDYLYVHADTGVEAKGTAEALDKFEAITKRTIKKLIPNKDMLTQIEDNGNFLPSQRQRSCTSSMKTYPFNRFYSELKSLHDGNVMIWNMVGIRADEPYRSGIEWKEDNVASVFPLASLGLVKQDINTIVDKIQLIPSYYNSYSRSGCEICIFSRRQEVLAAWENNPSVVERCANMEEVPSNVLKLYNAMPNSISHETGIARNYLTFYRPSWLSGTAKTGYEGKRGRLSNPNCKGTSDMFGDAKRLYVAVEYEYYDGLYSTTGPMVYFENIINYSTTLGGLKTSLKFFWLHRLHTKEMHGMSDEEMLGRYRKIAIIEMEVDNFDDEIPPAPQGIYTWQNDRKPLFAIRKTKAVIEHILLKEGLQQQLLSDDREAQASAREALDSVTQDYGRILNASAYQPLKQVDLEDDFDIEDAPTVCISCSK